MSSWQCEYYAYKNLYLIILIIGFTVVFQYCAIKFADVGELTRIYARDWIGATRLKGETRRQGVCELHDFSVPLLSGSADRMDCVPTQTSPSVTVCIYPPSMDVYISMSLLHRGHWEGHITRHILHIMLRYPQAGFLDLGANIGVHGLVVAKLNRTVVAVEPFLQNVKRIHKSVHINQLRSYRLVKNAVSDYRGEAWLDIGWRNIGGSTIEKDFSKDYNRKQKVQTIYMDDLLELITFTDVVIKVDIEGSEPRAFLKSARLFDQLNIIAIFMEWGQIRKLAPLSEENTRNIHKMINLFVEHNLVPHTLAESHKLDITNWTSWPHDLVWVSTLRKLPI